MKKKHQKLNLTQLKVKSFVTNADGKGMDTAKGGGSLIGCITKPSMCIFTACDCPTENPIQCWTKVQTGICCFAL